jgi:hypothetical protein
MPDPTDFVTDLPADFEIFGDAVDATVDGIDNRVTDLEVITTEGDLIVGDASGDPVRVPVGTVGQLLASDGDTVEWITPAAAGGITQLATGSLSGIATLTLSSISGSYKHLQLVCHDVEKPASNVVRLRLNNVTGTSYTLWRTVGGSTTNSGDSDSITIDQSFNATSYAETSYFINIYNYTLASNIQVQSFASGKNSSDVFYAQHTVGQMYDQNAAVDRIDLFTSSAGNFAGGTYILYGVS